MFVIDNLLVVWTILVILGIVSSRFAARLGLPVLVLFVVVGMLAGSEGLGGIEFEQYDVAHAVGTVALAIILFDGGLRTSYGAFRLAVGPAVSLATAGVLLTAAITAAAAVWLLQLPPLHALLLGSIVSSTDAAAVFSVLRGRGVNLRPRLASILEVESGANDPMAVFLTVACLQLILGEREPGIGMAGFFVMQMGIGAVTGLALGRLTVAVINSIRLDAAGLYPIITAAGGLLAYGLAASLGGSGFLAVYLAGIVIGNARFVFRPGTLLFLDAAAWLAQLVMFVLLGLLSFPSRLVEVAGAGLLIAAVLILVARPVAVALSLVPFRVNLRDTSFIAWVGLKGAVPIVLATYPLLMGVEFGSTIFDLVFFTVLVSAVVQGGSLPLVARLLNLQQPVRPEAAATLEITSLRDVDGDIVEYALEPRSRAVDRRLSEVRLPDDVVVALISRGDRIIAPRGTTRLLAGDHVFVVMHPRRRPVIDRLLGVARDTPLPAAAVEFPLAAATTRLQDLTEFYGVRLDGDPAATLAEYMEAALGAAPEVGTWIRRGNLVLRVLAVTDHHVEQVGLRIASGADASPDA